MAYIKFIDELSPIVKKILAIFLSIVFIVYRIIYDLEKNVENVMVKNIVLGIFPLPIVFWILNIIEIFTTGKVYSFAKK